MGEFLTISLLRDEFLWRALAGGMGVAAIAGPLGSFVVWRRLAYFGDTLAHSALLGVALGLLLQINLTVGIAGTCVLLAVTLSGLQRDRLLSGDTLLGILSHGTLALGLVVLALFGTVRIDLLSLLFGDILAIGRIDLLWIYGGGGLVLGALALLWRPLLAVTIDEDLARVEGVPTRGLELALMALVAITVAVAMKVVGVLLVTALLIIPAATARRFATTPEGMAIAAALVGAAAVAGGIGASLVWDTPTGPSVVVTAVVFFVLSRSVPAPGGRWIP